MARGYFQSLRSRKNSLKRCKMKEKTDNVVLIDVESDNFDEVIVIDGLEFLQQKTRGPSVLHPDQNPPSINTISIDDDEDDDYKNTHNDRSGDLHSDSHSSRISNPTSDGTECEFIRERYSYSNKASYRNRYGLTTDSESNSSESDCSDCEVMEGPPKKLHEEWEKASSKRKYSSRTVQSGLEDQTSASSSGVSPLAFNGKNHREPHCDIPVHSFSSYAEFKKYFNFKRQEPSPLFKAHSAKNGHNLNGKGGDWFRGETSSKSIPFSNDGFGLHAEKELNIPGPNLSSEKNNKFCNSKNTSQEEERTIFADPHKFDSNPDVELQSDKSDNDVFDKENEFDSEHLTCETRKQNELNNSSAKPSVCNSQLNEPCTGNSYSVKSKKPEFECNQPENKNNGMSISKEDGVTPVVEDDIINGRERFKETEEYKQAMEEEWAARNLQLQIQAEEAQRLRKRRRAESMRLLDMEKRQKQRLEEVRATQKQDEENMILKEKLRTEVRKELSKLEDTFKDMVSVLRGLGIQVGGGLYPLPHEVHVAYKKALLKFHPDRSSRFNMRQQVEAEEKFKFMARMKEKLQWIS